MRRCSIIVVLVLAVCAGGYARGEQETTVEETRPIYVLGVPSWAKESFGITLRTESGVPEGMAQPQALQLVITEGELPDVAFLGQMPNFDTMVELAEEGRLLPLDKYFNDPGRYPVWSSANRTYMRRYKVGGKIMGFPRYGWTEGNPTIPLGIDSWPTTYARCGVRGRLADASDADVSIR